MGSIFIIMLAGAMSTVAMTLFMLLVHSLGFANADMVRAIGSMITRKYEGSFFPGLAVHVTAGAFFALFYAFVAGVAPVPYHTAISLIITTTAVGTFHGLAMGVMLSVQVAEYHPVEQFREAGLDVVLSHVAGHIVYGVCLGMFLVVSRIDLKALPLVGS
jgi:hypothetical protein